MCRNRQGALAPLTPKVREEVNEIGLLWFLEGSSFDPVCSVVAVVRSAKV